MKLSDILLRGDRIDQPDPEDVPEATLYYVEDESVTEQAVGAIGARTWESYTDGGGTPPAPGALVLLASQTAASSATLDFTSIITSTYDEYVFELLNVVPATAGALLLTRASTNNGVSYDAASNYRYARRFNNQTGFASTDGSASATSMTLLGSIDNTVSTGGANGSFKLYNPLSATQNKFHIGEGTFKGTDTNHYLMAFMGTYLSITPVNAYRFLMDSGNILSGTIRCYGVAH